MKSRYLRGGAVLLVALVGLFTFTAVSAAKGKKHKTKLTIGAVSHTHPQPNPGYSYLCARLSGPPRLSVNAIANGPMGATSGDLLTLDAKGKGIADFKITEPGVWVIHAGKLMRRYTVPKPPPDGAAHGSFTCPSD